MACWIESHCNACGLCLAVCPVWAIREDNQQVWIDASFCTECLGYAEQPSCAFVCPIDAIGGAELPSPSGPASKPESASMLPLAGAIRNPGFAQTIGQRQQS